MATRLVHPTCRSVLGAALALLLLLVPSTAKAADDPGRLTPIVVSPVPQQAIIPVEGSDDQWHVMYELELTNTLEGPADLREVTVVDPARGRPLLQLDSEMIIAGEYLHTLHRTSAETTEFESNQARILILNLAFESRKSIPKRITHRFEVEGAEPFSQPPNEAEGKPRPPRRP